MPNNDFFNESSEQSRIKAQIVKKYFGAWAQIISSRAEKIGYIDLFAGPGRYVDGTISTPLLVLQKAIEDDKLRNRLVTMFNDADRDNVESLKTAISALTGIDTLRYKPIIFNREVGTEIAERFEKGNMIPCLFFVDPWGYKGLSLRLINSVLKDWGSDCIFFFNYNRINMGVNNESVEDHMEALFGEDSIPELREKLKGLFPLEREATIVEELALSLKRMGGRFVLPFRFRNDTGSRTTHHLIFVSKNFKGYDVMKGVMAKESSSDNDGVPSFEYNPATQRQPLLFALQRPLEDLKDMLVRDLQGQTLTMEEIYIQHSVDTPYISKNYKAVLNELEAEERITANPPARNRKKINGEPSFANHVVVKFP